MALSPFPTLSLIPGPMGPWATYAFHARYFPSALPKLCTNGHLPIPPTAPTPAPMGIWATLSFWQTALTTHYNCCFRTTSAHIRRG